MGRFRAQMRKARQGLHDYMSVPALYLTGRNAPAQLITVRVHHGAFMGGDLKGTNFNYAEMEDDSPRIIFMRSEVTPVRGALVVVAADEVYRLDAAKAPQDITVTHHVIRLDVEDRTGLPTPDKIHGYGSIKFNPFGA